MDHVEESLKSCSPQWIRTIVSAVISGLVAVGLGAQTGVLLRDDVDEDPRITLNTFASGAILFPLARTTACFITSLYGLAHYRKTFAFVSGGLVGIILGRKGSNPQQELGFITFGLLGFLIEMYYPFV